jgi:hypothetical protein
VQNEWTERIKQTERIEQTEAEVLERLGRLTAALARDERAPAAHYELSPQGPGQGFATLEFSCAAAADFVAKAPEDFRHDGRFHRRIELCSGGCYRVSFKAQHLPTLVAAICPAEEDAGADD